MRAELWLRDKGRGPYASTYVLVAKAQCANACNVPQTEPPPLCQHVSPFHRPPT